MRYEEIKKIAYQEALSTATELKEVVVITEDAGAEAELRQQEADNISSGLDIEGNEKRWSSIWYEAYQNHASTAQFQRKQEESLAILAKDKVTLSTLKLRIKTEKNTADRLFAELEVAEENLRTTQEEVDIQVEV